MKSLQPRVSQGETPPLLLVAKPPSASPDGNGCQERSEPCWSRDLLTFCFPRPVLGTDLKVSLELID